MGNQLDIDEALAICAKTYSWPTQNVAELINILSRTVRLRDDEISRLRAEVEEQRSRLAIAELAIQKFGPLQPPKSLTGAEVFNTTIQNDPNADMRAVPNQWLLNERAVSDKFSAEVEELRKDRARLDWIESVHEFWCVADMDETFELMVAYNDNESGEFKEDTIRAVIDKAMAKRDE